MIVDKNRILQENTRFKQNTKKEIERFIEITSKEMRDEAFRLQEKLNVRIEHTEAEVKDFREILD